MSDAHILMGTRQNGLPLALSPKAFRTHVAVLGMTGAGKTGVVLGMAEELVRNDVPIVMLDLKGDMANIFLQPEGAMGDQIAPRLITPGASHGESINIASGLMDSTRIPEAVTAILDLVGLDSDPIKNRHVFLTEILKSRHDKNQRCELEDIVMAIQEPPFSKIGALSLEGAINNKIRADLATKLNSVMVADAFEHWRTGIEFDLHALTKSRDGRTPVIVYSIAHIINDKQRTFAIALLMDAMVSYMRACSGTAELRMAFIVDECVGLMPPKGVSAIKTALMTLLKQGRSNGVGLILATQNPMDLDYKGMSNCDTWVIGRLSTENDRKRIVDKVCAEVPYINKKMLITRVGSLKPRQFLLARGENLVPFVSRTTSCDLIGPMDADALVKLVPKSSRFASKAVSKVLSIFK